MACASAIVALAGWQYWALGEPGTAEHRIALGTTSPATIDGPGEPPLPGSQPFEVFEQLPPFLPERLAAAGKPIVEAATAADHIVDANKMVEAATARVNAEGGQLTREEMIAVLRAAGWPESVIPDALAVAWCESRYSPYAINGGNFGLFQMNATDAATIRGPWFRYWGLPEDAWSDPVTNATAARLTYEYSLARNGYGWSPWSCRPS